ncbi:MAG: photosynthetic complex assembly protein PuhC [Pseudomonadota bacterium]
MSNDNQTPRTALQPTGTDLHISKAPLIACMCLVCAVTVAVFITVATGNGVQRDSAHGFRESARVLIERSADGTLHVHHAGEQREIMSFAFGPNQFLAGALRSINRMNGLPGDHLSSSYAIVRAGTSIAFLRDLETGNEVNLNAFGQLVTTQFVTAVGKQAAIGG